MLEEIKIEETWKDIENYKGKYQVSNLGRVKSCWRGIFKTIHYKERILVPREVSTGYLGVLLYDGKGVAKNVYIHRLVANYFIGEDTRTINHKDGNKHNNNISNIEYCSFLYNNIHARDMGLTQIKLNIKKVEEIRRLKKSGIATIEIAKQFNICTSYVNKLCSGKSKHWQPIGEK